MTKHTASRTGAVAFVCALVRVAPGHAQQIERGVNFRFAQPVRAFDVFVGQNKPGPYNLSWKNIRADHYGAVSVIVDGATLSGEAYKIDAKKGQVTFANSIASSSVVRVNYTYDAPVARRNDQPNAVPFTANLYKVGDTTLGLTILPGVGDNGDARLVWGMGRQAHLLGGGLAIQTYLSPDGGKSNPQTGLRWADRAGLSVGYTLGNDQNGLRATLTRAGRGLTPGAGTLFQIGETNQRTGLDAHRRLARWLAFTGGMTETRDLTGRGAAGQTTIGAQVGDGAANHAALAVTHTGDRSTDNQSHATRTTTDKIDATLPVNAATQITAQGQRTRTDKPTPADDQTTINGAVTVATKNDKRGQQIAVTLSGGSMVTGDTGTNRENRQGIQGIDVKAQPQKGVTLSAAQARTTAITSGDKVDANSHQTTITQTLGADVVPAKSVALSGAYQKTATPGSDAIRTVGTFGGTVGVGGRIELGAGYTTRTAPNAVDALDTTQARFALRPLNSVSLTGGLTFNPDNNGAILEGRRQDYGVTFRLGLLDFGSNYSLTTRMGDALTNIPGDSGPQFGEVGINVGLHVTRYTNLTGNYKSGFQYGILVPRGLRTYGLGLTHAVGSSLNLSLFGTMTEDRGQAGRPADLKAEAKVGIKF